jgi:CxxC motif-containing protein
MGCRLEVEDDGNSIIEVRGYSCKRGKDFAEQEHTDPRRMVTTTVTVAGGEIPRLPVKTREPIAKTRVKDLAKALHGVKVEAPIRVGDVILANPLNLGTDIVAARNVEAN